MSYTRFPTRFGKYILLDRINSGGMAEVYRAKVTGAERFQRLVAIKCMLSQLNEDEQFTTMFVDEAKLAAQLSHANIVQIYELGRINEQLYIAMELVNGRDLRHIIKRARAAQTPIPTGFAAYVISKAAEGLDFAHRKLGIDGSPLNLVHRDVSPQNILVSYDGEVKVVDFGIAKAEVRDTETRAGVLKGKFAYMAPEQVMGGEIDHRADIFALGAVLYETVTGKKLFRGESDFSILEKVRAAHVPSVLNSVADAPEEVDEILSKAMARDRDKRYAWASDLSEDMSPMLIDNRSIFGTKQAKEFMQTLYADDIDFLAQQLREYAKIGKEDCLETSAQKKEPRISEVFESDFSTLDEPLDALFGTDDDEDQPATRLSDRQQPEKMDKQRTGWTGVGTDPGFGEGVAEADSTQLFDESSAPRPEPSHPSRVRRIDPMAETDRAGRSRGSAPRRRPSAQPLRPIPLPMEGPASGLSQPQPQAAGGMGKPILVGLIVATMFVLVAVVVVFVVTRNKGPTSTVVMPVTVPTQPVAPTAQPTPTNSVVVGSGINEPEPTPAPEPTPTPAPEPVEEQPTPENEEPPPIEEQNDQTKKKRPKKARFGFVSVSAKGVKAAKVFIDGKEVGYSPLVYQRVRTGKHRIKVIEEGGTKSKVLDVIVGANNTRKDPLRLFVNL